MDVNIDFEDVSQAWRLVRKIPIPNKPNPVKISFKTASAKERIMRAKYKLKHQEGTEQVWINHDEPTAIRRAKGRARHIATYSRRKGSNAEITPSGIILEYIPSIYIPPVGIQYPLQQRSLNGGPHSSSAVNRTAPVLAPFDL